MATTYGPSETDIENGLIYCFDAKNRNCWSGGNTVYNLPTLPYSTLSDNTSKARVSGSSYNDTNFDGALSSYGYVSFDGTDDTILLGPISGSGVASDHNQGIELFALPNELTLSVWVRSNSAGSSQTPFSYMGGSGTDSGWRILLASSYFEFKVAAPGATQNDARAKFQNSGASTVSSDTWYNIVGVKKDNALSNNVVVYQNNVLGSGGDSTQGTANGIEYEASHNLYTPVRAFIGTAFLTPGSGYDINSWNGDIAIVKVWNRALTDDELTTHWNTNRHRFEL